MVKASNNINILKQDIDETDLEIIKLLIGGDNNKEISFNLKIPLSTVQRRTKRILDRDFIVSNRSLNYTKLGYRVGLLHVYSSDGNVDDMAKKVLSLYGVTSVEIHIGNSDVLADFVYKDGMALFDTLSKIRKIQGVERVIWSERITKQSKKFGDENMLLKYENFF